MKGFQRILISAYLGLSAYLVASVFFGGSGVLAIRRLELYRDRLDENISELAERNMELEAEVQSLLSDPERVRLEARSLGYYADNEGVIKYSGRSVETRSVTLGRILRERMERNDARSVLRAAALAVAVVCYIFLTYRKSTHGAE